MILRETAVLLRDGQAVNPETVVLDDVVVQLLAGETVDRVQ